jgi:hypothetical protein
MIYHACEVGWLLVGLFFLSAAAYGLVKLDRRLSLVGLVAFVLWAALIAHVAPWESLIE